MKDERKFKKVKPPEFSVQTKKSISQVKKLIFSNTVPER